MRLEALQAAKPAVQALYRALPPEQRAIFDHPFRRYRDAHRHAAQHNAHGTTRLIEHDSHAGGAVEQTFQMKAHQLVVAA
jgi:hypothetical protein